MFRGLSSRKDAFGSAAAAAAGIATAARLAAARLAAAAVAMAQAAQATQDRAAAARAAGLAAAAVFAATARLGTAARLSGAAGLFGTTTARFATTGRFAAAIVAMEQVEQAAAVATAGRTARLATTGRLAATTAAMAQEAKAGRSAVGAREHHGGAQDKRQTNTSVHRRLLTETETGGEHTGERHDANSPRTTAHLASAYRSRRRIAATATHDVGNVINRYRQRRSASFTNRTNLPEMANRGAWDVGLCGLFSIGRGPACGRTRDAQS